MTTTNTNPSEMTRTKERSRFLLFLACCAGVLGGGCEEGPSVTPRRAPPPVIPDPLDDHGNTREQATRVETTSSTEGELESDGDIDYFSVQVHSGFAAGVLTVTTTGETDTVGALLLPDGTQLTNDDASSTQDYHEQNFRITADVTVGVYYIAVRGWCGDDGCETGPYVLHVVLSAPAEDDYGNTSDTASEIRIPSTTHGVLESRGDVDFFRLEVPTTGGLLTATTTGSLDTVGQLIFPDGTHLSDDDSGAFSNFRIETRVLNEGTHYVSVAAWCGWRCPTGEYFLHITLSEPAPLAAEPYED